MRRRAFAAFVLGSAAWPPAASAQQPMPVVGWLHTDQPEGVVVERAAFVQGLADQGFIEGRTVAIEYRWARGDYARLPALAAELVALKVAVIFGGPLNSTLAAKGATAGIPIVFNVGIDPVAFGLVASFNKPGGNLTGIAELLGELWPKRLQLLHELLPAATRVGVLVNPRNSNAEKNVQDVQGAAKALGLQLVVLHASTDGEIDAAFAAVPQQGLDALLIGDDPYFRGASPRLAETARRHRVAAVSFTRPFAAAGGLMAYGPDFSATYGKAGQYVGRVLKGAKPAELPVEQPNKLELVLNRGAARALGIALPASLLARVDEIIE